MSNWVKNFWFQGACAVCCILVVLFAGLTAFHFAIGVHCFKVLFTIDLILASIVFVGLHGWGNTILGFILLLLNLAFMIVSIVMFRKFSDASLMLVLSTISSFFIGLFSALCA